MIELILYALFSQKSADFFSPVSPMEGPKIEILSLEPVAQQNPAKIAPKLLENPTTAFLAADAESGKTLLQKNAYRSQEIASLTKLMTALLVLDEHSFGEVVQVDPVAAKTIGASIDIYAYEKISVRTLLEAVLISSANDAAVALAIHNAGTEEDFVKKMNQKAQDLGLYSAKFYNATGLDVYDPVTGEPHGNVMSAKDLLQLSRIILRNDFVRMTVAKGRFTGSSVDRRFTHTKKTTNALLGTFLNLKGLKTGYTELAGQCFVALGENNEGREVLTIILGSEDRFGETKKLLSWIYDAFEWR